MPIIKTGITRSVRTGQKLTLPALLCEKYGIVGECFFSNMDGFLYLSTAEVPGAFNQPCRVDAEHRVTVPKSFCDTLRITKGTILEFFLDEQKVRGVLMKPFAVRDVFGSSDTRQVVVDGLAVSLESFQRLQKAFYDGNFLD